MHPLFVIGCVLVLTSISSVLLASRFLPSGRRTITGIGLLIFWLSALIIPLQCLAALELLGLTSALHVDSLLIPSGFLIALSFLLWSKRKRLTLDHEGSAIQAWRPFGIPFHVGLGLAIVAAVYVILAARMAFSFPDDSDAVAYHYPIALRWLQEGTLRISSDTDWRASLPGNVELLDLLGLYTGYDRLLGVVQWPGLVVLLLATLELVSRLSKSSLAAWPVATTVLMIPIVAMQSMSGYVELFCTALIFGSVALLFEVFSRPHFEDPVRSHGALAAAGLGCGLAVGAKPVFWLHAGLVFLCTLLLLWWKSRDRPRTQWLSLAVFASACALPCLFWFARALLCTGNPVYPLAIQIGPLDLSGVETSAITKPDYYLTHVRNPAEWLVYPWLEWKRSPGFLGINYTIDSGLGGAFATFVLPGLFYAAWLARSRRTDLRIWLFALVALAAAWWFLLQKVGRFALPLFVLAAILSAPFFECLEKNPLRRYKVLYTLVVAVTACVLVFEPLYTIVQTIRYKSWSRSEYYGYPEVIDRFGPDTRILNLGEDIVNHPLAGSGLRNRVITGWECPTDVTKEFLVGRQVDYVVEKLSQSGMDLGQPTGAPVEGLELYFRAPGREGEEAEWRIWSAERLRRGSDGR